MKEKPQYINILYKLTNNRIGGDKIIEHIRLYVLHLSYNKTRDVFLLLSE